MRISDWSSDVCSSDLDDESLDRAMDQLIGFGSLGKEGGLSAERPVLIDRFLEDATEVDVDAIRDHTGDVVIGGVMEHVEEAGVPSGDSDRKSVVEGKRV